MFDALIREAAERYGLATAEAAAILQSLLTYVFREHPGSLTGFIDSLRRDDGLADVLASWVGGRSPREIAPERVEAAIGPDVLSRISAVARLDRSIVIPVAAFLLPKLIAQLTRDGIPAGVPTGVGSYLAAPAHHAPRAADPSPLRWLGWLLVPLVALIIWRSCTTPSGPTPDPTPRPVATAATAPTPALPPLGAALPATVFFDLAEQALDAEGQATVAAVAGYLAASPAAKVAITGYADRTGARETNLEIARERAKCVRAALEAAGIGEDRIRMQPPAFVTGSGSDTEARRVEIHETS